MDGVMYANNFIFWGGKLLILVIYLESPNKNNVKIDDFSLDHLENNHWTAPISPLLEKTQQSNFASIKPLANNNTVHLPINFGIHLGKKWSISAACSLLDIRLKSSNSTWE